MLPAPLDRQERLVLLALLDRPAKMGKEEPPARRVLQVLPALLLRQYMHNTEIAVTMRLSTILKTIKQPL